MTKISGPVVALCRLAAVAVVALGATAGWSPASAQDQMTVTPASPPTPQIPEPEPSHLAAAIDFLKASGSTKGFDLMIPQFLDQVRLRYVTQRPEIADLINDSSMSLIGEFVKRREDLNRDIAKLYTQRFTEDELKQLTEFYRSPVGQKLSTEQIDILQQSVPIVQVWSRKLTEDMALRVKEEVKKRGQQL